MSYDDNGQLVRREKSTGEVTCYEWNDQGMLVKVILPTGEAVEYFYDGNQRITGRKSDEGFDQFVQSGWDIVTKMDDVGKRTYYTGSSAVESEDSVKYFHYNHRGDTVLVTDSEGNTLNNFSYEAYGRPTNSEGIPFNNLSIKDLPNLFIGASGIRYDTKTDLHYMRFRWFSGEQMRFISADLLMDLNRYAYVSGNPVNQIDSKGLYEYEIKDIENFVYCESYNESETPIITVGYVNPKTGTMPIMITKANTAAKTAEEALGQKKRDDDKDFQSVYKRYVSQQRGKLNSMVIEDINNRTNFIQNCHLYAERPDEQAYISNDQSDAILNFATSPVTNFFNSYSKEIKDKIREGDTVKYGSVNSNKFRYDHTGTVFYVFKNAPAIIIIERDGYGAVYSTDHWGLEKIGYSHAQFRRWNNGAGIYIDGRIMRPFDYMKRKHSSLYNSYKALDALIGEMQKFRLNNSSCKK